MWKPTLSAPDSQASSMKIDYRRHEYCSAECGCRADRWWIEIETDILVSDLLICHGSVWRQVPCHLGVGARTKLREFVMGDRELGIASSFHTPKPGTDNTAAPAPSLAARQCSEVPKLNIKHQRTRLLHHHHLDKKDTQSLTPWSSTGGGRPLPIKTLTPGLVTSLIVTKM